MIDTTSDIAAMLADFGQACTWAAAPGGARTANAIFNAPGVDLLGGQIISTDYEITYAVADLPGLASGAQLSIGGAAYQVREVHALDDGAIAHATLAKV